MGWEEFYEELLKFKERYNHTKIPRNYITPDGLKLGQWAGSQRQLKEQMKEDRRFKLNQIGFVWDSFADSWEQGYQQLLKCFNQNGSLKIPGNFKTDTGFNLTAWVKNQRKKKDALTEEQLNKLNKLGFIWNELDKLWNLGYEHLEEYVKENRSLLVPAIYKSLDGYRLGNWVAMQRKKKNMLSNDRRKKLDELGFVWNVKSKT